MVNTYISPVISRAAELGVRGYEDNKIIELRPNDSGEAVETVIRAVYRQVLGNAYVMESERLAVPESKLKQRSLSVREFVREVAYSELYKSRFFDSCPRYRSIELNFKHLLGRAPDSYDETNAHSLILDQGGYQAEVDSYLDSEEYQNKFGENIVPYYCGYKTQTGKNIVGFTHLFKLLRGASCSDKKLTTKDEPRLTTSLINNTPSAIVPPSNGSSYGGVTDIDKLLTNALSLNKAPVKIADQKQTSQTNHEQFDQFTSSFSVFPQSYSSKEEQSQHQEQEIVRLEQKLASLTTFASIGMSQTNKWQSSGMARGSVESISPSPQSSDRVIAQQQAIACLEEKIADAQRLANIGEARLNKWRSRSFS